MAHLCFLHWTTMEKYTLLVSDFLLDLLINWKLRNGTRLTLDFYITFAKHIYHMICDEFLLNLSVHLFQILLQKRDPGASGRTQTCLQVWKECKRMEGVRHVNILFIFSFLWCLMQIWCYIVVFTECLW